MIKIKTFVFNNLQVNSLIIYDETKSAILIDPACQYPRENEILSDFIKSQQIIPVKIALTHGHADHLAGINYCINKYQIPFQMHTDDLFLLESAVEIGKLYGFELESIPPPNSFINEGEKLEFGNSSLEIFHVPGHSPGSIVFYSAKDAILIAGDVLFNGSIGRTDLPGGDYETLISGISKKLLTLPRETIVYPGHGPSTTIGKEHDTNPFLI